MAKPVKRITESMSLVKPLRFKPSQWKKIRDAAAVLSQREERTVPPAEVARLGALRRADEILAGAA